MIDMLDLTVVTDQLDQAGLDALKGRVVESAEGLNNALDMIEEAIAEGLDPQTQARLRTLASDARFTLTVLHRILERRAAA